MNLVLTMAGKYSRFKLFGSKVPKYLLPLGGGTVLLEVLSSLLKCSNPTQVYLIANKNDQLFYPILRSVVCSFGIDPSNIYYIDDTRSQLETAMSARKLIKADAASNPVVFMNIDTVVKHREEFFLKLNGLAGESGLVDVFPAASHQYSYINPGPSGNVLSITDGKAVSQLACSGMYGFGSLEYMLTTAEDVLAKTQHANFTYLYNYMLQHGKLVKFNMSQDKRDTVVLGTPEEYVINIHRFA